MTELTDLRRRWLRSFCRAHLAINDAPQSVRRSIDSLARSIDAGGLSRADLHENLRLLDDLLAEEVGRGYVEGRNPED